MIDVGFSLLKKGRINEAVDFFRKFILLNPDSYEAHFTLGVIYAKTEKNLDAIRQFIKAHSIRPNSIDPVYNLALLYLANEEYQLALQYLEIAGELSPCDTEVLSAYSNALKGLGSLEAEIEYMHKKLTQKPTDFLWLSLGLAHEKNQDLSNALISIENAINLNHRNYYAYYKKAVLHYEGREFDSGLSACNDALKASKNFLDARYLKALLLYQLNRYEEALIDLKSLVEIKPDYIAAYFDMGVITSFLGRDEEAISFYEKVLELAPNSYQALCNKGSALHNIGKYFDAIEAYDEALCIYPESPQTLLNKADSLRELRRYKESIDYYSRAYRLNPELPCVLGQLIYAKLLICDWENIDSYIELVETSISKQLISQPFPILAVSRSEELNSRVAQAWINYKLPRIEGFKKKITPGSRVRIAYFSADFHNHATAYLMAGLFKAHDRSKFEVIGISFGPNYDDVYRKKLSENFDSFIDVTDMTDFEVAKMSREMNIDIAVDLKGFTRDSRPGIFSHRAAPIQINYLGYPGSVPIDGIDYIVADSVIIPPKNKPFFSEKIIYLPNSYQVNDTERDGDKKIWTRRELGLPERSFVYCCFNNSYKILPETFSVWMRILKETEGSVLWLLEDSHLARLNLLREAKKRGIAENRLIFAGRVEMTEHLSRQTCADLFLDTWPCNAHTTASDALWVGLPIVTLIGETFAGRVASSLLCAIDMPELVTQTTEQYFALAVKIAKDPTYFAEIKNCLKKNRMESPLFDTARTTKYLEAAYLEAYKNKIDGQNPRDIFINS